DDFLSDDSVDKDFGLIQRFPDFVDLGLILSANKFFSRFQEPVLHLLKFEVQWNTQVWLLARYHLIGLIAIRNFERNDPAHKVIHCDDMVSFWDTDIEHAFQRKDHFFRQVVVAGKVDHDCPGFWFLVWVSWYVRHEFLRCECELSVNVISAESLFKN